MGSRQKHLQSGVYLVSRRSALLTSKLEHGPGGGGGGGGGGGEGGGGGGG